MRIHHSVAFGFLLVTVVASAVGGTGIRTAPPPPVRPPITIPASAPLNAAIATAITPAMSSSASALFAAVPLGSTHDYVLQRLGRPWFVSRLPDSAYWAYSVDDDRAWFVVTLRADRVECVQVVPKAFTTSALRDSQGAAFGGSVPAGAEAFDSAATAIQRSRAQNLRGFERAGNVVEDGVIIHQVQHDVFSDQSFGGAFHFFGADARHHIDRFGLSVGLTDLPANIRWFQPNGLSRRTPISLSMVGANSATARNAFLANYQQRAWQCVGGAHWTVLSEASDKESSVPEVAAKVACGKNRGFRTMFFLTSEKQARPFDSDTSSMAELFGASGRSNAGVNRPLLGASPGPGMIYWEDAGNGGRFILGPTGSNMIDVRTAIVADPNASLQSVTLVPATPAAQTFAPQATGTAPPSPATAFSPIACAIDANNDIKCVTPISDQAQTIGGQICARAQAVFGTGSSAYTVTTPVNCFLMTDGSRFATKGNDYCFWCAINRMATLLPVDAATGMLAYDRKDVALSGPFGLLFARQYRSDLPTFAGDLGLGWRSNYGAHLDLTTTSKNSLVTYFDADGDRTYLQSAGTGTFYDQFTGSTLITNSDGTFVLSTWTHETITFDSLGRLSKMTDRNGNTQTIARDSSGRVAVVTDTLGRSLTFAYNGTDKRIATVTSSPGGVNLVLTYDSGTGCTTGDLCSIKESDGAVWSYQYLVGSNGGHYLTQVTNPNGHIEESTTYVSFVDGDGTTQYRVGEQYTGSSQDDVKFDYTQDPAIRVTDTPVVGDPQVTTYDIDHSTNSVADVRGFGCRCGDGVMYYTWDTFDRLLAKVGPSVNDSYSYGRDIILTKPAGADSPGSYIATPYQGPTQVTDGGLPPHTEAISYEPLTTPFQDLVKESSAASVPQPSATAASSYVYNTQGLPTQITRSGFVGTTATAYTTTAGWDANGRLTSLKLPRTDINQTTSLKYFSNTDSDFARRGQLMNVTDPLGHVVAFATATSGYGNSYTVYGEPQTMTDENGVVWQYYYDAVGRKKSSGISAADTTSYKYLPGTIIDNYGYDLLGNLKSVAGTLGGVSYSYDSSERLAAHALIDKSGTALDLENYSYDLESELTTLTRSCGSSNMACATGSVYGSSSPAFVMGYQYDASGMPMSSTAASVQGNSSSGGLPSPAPIATATYEAFTIRGDLIQTDQISVNGTNGAFKSIGHDPIDQITGAARLSSGNSLYANFTYDSNHNLSTSSAQSLPTTTYTHDDFDRVTNETSALSGNWSYTYDADGNEITVTDPNGSVTTKTYDALNRPLSSKSAKSGATETTSWTYDSVVAGAFGIGRLATMADPSGSSTYVYEPRGLLVKKQQTLNGGTYSSAYSYDVDGDLATETMPSTRVLTFGYDYAHRPVTLSGMYAGKMTNYITGALYLPFGPNTRLTYGNGVTQTWTFNQRFLPYEDKVAMNSAKLSDVAYAEDNIGQITQIDDLISPTYDRTMVYGNSGNTPGDMLSTVSTGSALWGTASYTAAGLVYNNPSGEDLTTLSVGSHTINAGFDTNDHLNRVVSNGNSLSATVDAAGNQTLLNGAAYSYSPRNLMASGEGISYAYDGFGKRVLSSSSTGTQASIYDENDNLESETSPSTTSVMYDYIWFNGKPVAQENLGASPATAFTHTNELGEPFLQTSPSATRTWQADYDPYGSIYSLRAGSATIHQPLRLPGQEAIMLPGLIGLNGSSQLLYNHSRWYIPTLGRYLTPDPIGVASDPYDEYAYVGSNPASHIDRNGLFGEDENFEDPGELDFWENLAREESIPTPSQIQQEIANKAESEVSSTESYCPANGQAAELHLASEASARNYEAQQRRTDEYERFRFQTPPDLQEHFEDHGNDFGDESPEEYEQNAVNFMISERGENVLEGTRVRNGDLIRYDEETEEYGILSADGFIKTYYRPDPLEHGMANNVDYFWREVKN